MIIFLNFGLAWISVILGFLLSIIYILRIVNRTSRNSLSMLVSLNKNLRKYHIVLGVLLIITGLVHGISSSQSVFSFNLGTLCWIISILLGISWIIRKKFKKGITWIKLHRVLTVIFVVSIIWHVIDVGGIQIFNVLGGNINSTNNNDTNDNSVIDSIDKQLQYGTFKDGIYTGVATGYKDGLKVQIEIKENTIISLDIIEHNEVFSKIYQKAFDGVTEEILKNQSVEVDTVSGATYSSIGIMNAVNDALSEALVEGTLPDNIDLPEKRKKH